MKLEDCTREELLEIIKTGCEASFISKFKVERYLAELEYNRNQKTIEEAKKWAEISSDSRKKYISLVAPYINKRVCDVPIHILNELNQLLRAERRADREYELCMKRLGD